ncbi:cyclodeaminase/cyclohydrolase family protein [Candidatus Bipolaricaulota bacterium]|nr:cyclodeaminase/cyclohydrolase family protein [Candidatus Bipolaricaulota bacterium]
MSEQTDLDPRNQKLGDFLEDLASSKPAPGGGSAAAVAGALGAALSSMVANLTLGKEKYKEVESKFEGILERAERLRNEFLEAVEEDVKAYNEVMAAYGLPKETEEEKEKRRETLQSALKGATRPPFKMAELADEVLELSKECALSGNTHAVTDAGASAILAEATVRTALLNVDINLSSISDSSFVDEKRRKRKDLSEKAQKKAEEIVKIMDGKI